MVEAQIKRIDLSRRTVVVLTADGQELTLTFPEGANIEVTEPSTLGTMGGDLHDLREGYFVRLELGQREADGRCACASLVCIS